MAKDRAPVSSVDAANRRLACRRARATIHRIVLNVADLATACAFYVGALGFTPVSDSTTGANGGVILRLGRQDIELRPAGGRPYPQPMAANDPWFQHFAIAVSDMPQAYAHLVQYGHQPISRGGPQRLPPSTGSVTAYKFRDPDGHPLELSYILGSDWLQAAAAADNLFLGIDHTALAVCDLEASIAFYRDLGGFNLGGRGLNSGLEQDRLDGLDQVQVDIVSMTTALGAHIELLRYRSPCPTAALQDIDRCDVAATLLVLNAPDGAPQPLRKQMGLEGEGQLIRDPDGHWLRWS